MGVFNTDSFSGPFYPNGLTTTFPFKFRAMASSEVVLVDADGEQVTGASFSVVLASNQDGGSVIFDAPPTASQIPPFLIASAPAFGVGIDLGSVTAFNPRTLNPSFERLSVQNIFLKAASDRSLRMPIGEQIDPLPPAAGRSQTVMAFTRLGQPYPLPVFDIMRQAGTNIMDGGVRGGAIELDGGARG